jgi:hypothetical protein
MRKTWLLFILTSCTQQSKKTFGTIDPNPIVESRKANKIKFYETFSINADSIVKDGIYKLDDNGRTIEIRNLNITQIDQQTSYLEYDSLGQQYMIGDQKFTYEGFPDQQLLIVKTYSQGLDDKSVSLLKFDKDLKYILRKMHLATKDTVVDFTYEYKNGKLIKVQAKDHLIEYHYDQSDKLKEVRTMSGFGINVDYISPATGLVDSTVSDESGQKFVTYYKYYK